MSRFLTRWFTFCFVLLAATPLWAEVRLPALFSDHMVLQQTTVAPVWGWAGGDEKITVTVAGQTQTAQADAKGKWLVKFPALKAGGPHTLIVQGAQNKLTVEDVLIGEVWLGSGQSNMAMTVSSSNNYAGEQSTANLPQVRMFTVSSTASDTPQEDCTGSWAVCSADTVGRFSATLYFFGRDIHAALQTPVGLINSSVGGTPIESWVDRAAQESQPELKPFLETARTAEAAYNPKAATAKYERDLAKWKEEAAKAKADKKPVPRAPQDPAAVRARKGNIGGLFNGKIAPLVPYGIRGVLWYQGEANSNDVKAPYYQHHLSLLVRDWRQRWGSELPFAWVQLPNFGREGGWLLVREAMLKTLALPQTGMAITIDVGDVKDIHPKNKQAVGQRLALWALGTVYGKPVATSGPLPGKLTISGREATIAFLHTDGGLVAKEGELRGFVIAGADKQWKPAQAKIVGQTVVVSSSEVEQPVAVRYAWSGNPDCNLYNGAGLPASPFRTDTDAAP